MVDYIMRDVWIDNNKSLLILMSEPREQKSLALGEKCTTVIYLIVILFSIYAIGEIYSAYTVKELMTSCDQLTRRL